jgi:hypothetical protein
MAKEKYKIQFKKALDTFADKLHSYVATETGEWSVKGFDFFAAEKWKIAKKY